ncbi:MAG TPA: tetratricopeptide repeat protein [Chryseosolibacter sp.]
MDYLDSEFDKATVASENGDTDEAIRIYQGILEKKEDWANVHYNLGLIFKYRNEWDKSYHHNQRAVELDPNSNAAKWNLGIAATMLKDWRVARQCWNSFGMNYKIIDEDTAGNIGDTSIRISPDNHPETVWATRICPARAVIKNIPLPESDHRFRDIVLNDGAPSGYRMSDGREYPVLNEIQHLTKSAYQTFSVKCKFNQEEDFAKLQQLCWAADIGIENWTADVQFLCKQCSEGKPHETHDHELKNQNGESRIAFASNSKEKLKQIIDQWCIETGNDYYDSCSY